MSEDIMEELEPNVVDTKEETDRHCPDCGGVMEFDPQTGGLACPFCGHKEEIPTDETIPETAQELDLASADNVENCNWGTEKKTVICKACAAEIVYDALETASVCPFCGSNQVMEAHEENTIAPGGVVPFSIDDKEASVRFHEWIKHKLFCPRLAKQSAKPKAFKGVYMPYWTFDTETTSNYVGQYGNDHTYTDSDGDTHTRTDWHNTSGTYREFIDDQLVFASTRHDSSMVEGIEPYDTTKNKAYKPEYIAGFMSERYSIGLKDAWNIAKQKIHSRLESAIAHKIKTDHHADHGRVTSFNTIYQDVTYKYLLLPVWISNYKYKEKVYRFMVNGQTGEISGKTPVSIPRVIAAVAIGIAVCVGLYYIFR